MPGMPSNLKTARSAKQLIIDTETKARRIRLSSFLAGRSQPLVNRIIKRIATPIRSETYTDVRLIAVSIKVTKK